MGTLMNNTTHDGERGKNDCLDVQSQGGTMPLIKLHQVDKVYQSAAGGYQALKGVDLEIKGGEFVGIIGRSGSGKSTLINMITGIDRPTAGEVLVGQLACGMPFLDQVLFRTNRAVRECAGAA
jgi:ABC-type oligopeptide transport system ATPase subunit